MGSRYGRNKNRKKDRKAQKNRRKGSGKLWKRCGMKDSAKGKKYEKKERIAQKN